MAGRRQNRKDSDPFGDEVVLAWCMTTLPQREQVFEDWMTGRQQYHKAIAPLLHLNPIALLLAVFLEFEHPSVCHPNGRPRAIHYGKLCEMIFKPVDNSPFPVDNSVFSVDNSVEKSVDNSGVIHREAGFPQLAENFSTGAEVFHYLSTTTCG